MMRCVRLSLWGINNTKTNTLKKKKRQRSQTVKDNKLKYKVAVNRAYATSLVARTQLQRHVNDMCEISTTFAENF